MNVYDITNNSKEIFIYNLDTINIDLISDGINANFFVRNNGNTIIFPTEIENISYCEEILFYLIDKIFYDNNLPSLLLFNNINIKKIMLNNNKEYNQANDNRIIRTTL